MSDIIANFAPDLKQLTDTKSNNMTDIGKCIVEGRLVKGSPLYSPIFGKITFNKIDPNPDAAGVCDIYCLDSLNMQRVFTSYGKYYYHNSNCTPEVMLFPDERERDWEKWLASLTAKRIGKHPYDRMKIAQAEMMGEKMDARVLKPFSSYRTYNITELQGFSVHELVSGQKSSCGYHLEPCDDMVRHLGQTSADPELIDFIEKCNQNHPRYYMLCKGKKNCGLVAVLYKGEQIENDYYSHSI